MPKMHSNGATTARCVAYTMTWKISNVDGMSKKKPSERSTSAMQLKMKTKEKVKVVCKSIVLCVFRFSLHKPEYVQFC